VAASVRHSSKILLRYSAPGLQWCLSATEHSDKKKRSAPVHGRVGIAIDGMAGARGSFHSGPTKNRDGAARRADESLILQCAGCLGHPNTAHAESPDSSGFIADINLNT
jgi:hypothetical protein